MQIPSLSNFIERVGSQDLQRTNLYYVKLPIATMVSTALGAGLNSILSQIPNSRLEAGIPINNLSDSIAGGIENIPAPRNLIRLASNELASEYSSNMLVSSIGLPDISVESEINQNDPLRDSMATGTTAGEIPVTMMCTSGAPELAAIWSWLSQVQDPATGRMGFKNEYAKGKIMEIVLLTRDFKTRAKYTFFDVRPVNLQAVNMSWESNDEIMKIETSFKYRGHRFETVV